MDIQFNNFKDSDLRLIGFKCLELIRKRTLDGKDVNDKPFKPYSTKTFGMPLGAMKKHIQGTLKKENKLYMKNGSTWVLIHGGYLAFKQAAKKKTDWDGHTVNLSFTGAMLRNLNVIGVADNTIKIGFTNTEMAQRAYYNTLKGRDFLGISPNDLKDTVLIDLIKQAVINMGI